MPGYQHTQRGSMWWLLVLLAAVALAAGQSATERDLRWVLVVAAVLFAALASTVASLTVRDRDDALEVRFGPMPLWGTRLRYDDVRGLRRARSSLIDSWGIHWVPGRGWTYNLWGRDCVELDTARGRRRIGTDDADGLLRFLAARTGAPVG